jgi:hypothetical protein
MAGTPSASERSRCLTRHSSSSSSCPSHSIHNEQHHRRILTYIHPANHHAPDYAITHAKAKALCKRNIKVWKCNRTLPATVANLRRQYQTAISPSTSASHLIVDFTCRERPQCGKIQAISCYSAPQVILLSCKHRNIAQSSQ